MIDKTAMMTSLISKFDGSVSVSKVFYGRMCARVHSNECTCSMYECLCLYCDLQKKNNSLVGY